ncbi:MAG: hypothetical protein IKI75_06240 [Lachnospiraceae bacterium]|nr:hypothetical protein [Lachnospiraceae bacterium]
MKEQLYTIPLNDAVNAGDECPFCFVERSLEQDSLDFVLGSCASYMESDVRELTDAQGFCREHFKKMFDYGNTLGNGWILKTHYMKLRGELDAEIKRFKPGHLSLADRLRKKAAENNLVSWVNAKKDSCYVCRHSAEIYARYLDTFFVMWKSDESFRKRILESKGFCISHFGDLCAAADEKLSGTQLDEFYDAILPLMQRNLDRLQEDVNWLIEKFDYRNSDADWKNSKDAVQRGMQKIKGGYPADPPLKSKK